MISSTQVRSRLKTYWKINTFAALPVISSEYNDICVKIIERNKKALSVAAASNVATEILRQLGGNKFIAMTGAKDFAAGKDHLYFGLPKNKSGANKVKITLNSKDLYDIIFYRYRSLDLKELVKKTDVDIAQLRKVFEDVTELRTSL